MSELAAPSRMERPHAGDEPLQYRVWLYAGENLEDLPVLIAANNLGHDRSGNLNAVQKPPKTVGIYFADYAVGSDHPAEPMVFTALIGEESVIARAEVLAPSVYGYTGADRMRDDQIAQILVVLRDRIPAAIAPAKDLYSVLGKPTGQNLAADIRDCQRSSREARTASEAVSKIFTGITSMAGWLKLIFRRDGFDSLARHEINGGSGEFDETLHSLEALAALQKRSDGGGVNSVTSFTRDALEQLRAFMVEVQQPASVSHPVSIVRGMAYHAAENRAIVWTDRRGAWPDLSGATITVLAWKDSDTRTFHGEVLDEKRVRLQLTGQQSRSMKAGEWAYGVVATLPNTRSVDLVKPGSKWEVVQFARRKKKRVK